MSPNTFDLSKTMKLVADDESFFQEIVRIFIDTCPENLSGIHRAVDAKDAQALEDQAHTIKGSMANFGAQRACEAALALEILGRQGDLSGAKTCLEVLDREIKALISELEAESLKMEKR